MAAFDTSLPYERGDLAPHVVVKGKAQQRARAPRQLLSQSNNKCGVGPEAVAGVRKRSRVLVDGGNHDDVRVAHSFRSKLESAAVLRNGNAHNAGVVPKIATRFGKRQPFALQDAAHELLAAADVFRQLQAPGVESKELPIVRRQHHLHRKANAPAKHRPRKRKRIRIVLDRQSHDALVVTHAVGSVAQRQPSVADRKAHHAFVVSQVLAGVRQRVPGLAQSSRNDVHVALQTRAGVR